MKNSSRIYNENFAATAQEEAEKINAQAGPGLWGMTLVTDQEFWEERGISTGEELAFSILSQTYSDAYKSLHGIRPRWAKFETVDQVQQAIDELDREAEAMAEDQAFWAKREAEWEKERQELAALQVPGLDLEYEKVPQRSGMGRRHEGVEKRTFRTTRKRLKQIIESVSQEINEMPVTKSRGWGMDKYEERYPHLVEFANEVNALFEDWAIFDVNVKMFDSGYSGLSIEFVNEQGTKQKWLVVDQSGNVGLEDQTMGYIYFGPGGKAIQESNAWVWEKVPYLGRRFGDTEMRPENRARIYDLILDTMDDMLTDTQDFNEGHNKGLNTLNKMIKEATDPIKQEPEYQALKRISRKLDKGMGIDAANIDSLYYGLRTQYGRSPNAALEYIFSRSMPTDQLAMAYEQPEFAEYGDIIANHHDSRVGNSPPTKLQTGEYGWGDE